MFSGFIVFSNKTHFVIIKRYDSKFGGVCVMCGVVWCGVVVCSNHQEQSICLSSDLLAVCLYPAVFCVVL